MKEKIKNILIYVISFLICSKIYFGLYEFIVNEVFILPLEVIVLTDLFALLLSIPIVIAGTILITKLLKKELHAFISKIERNS